jgi:hypothetical protein
MSRKLKKGQKNARPILFCFWTGNNKLNKNRKKNLKSLKNTGLDIHFINVDNLDKYILKDHPLHPGYKYLSDVHKADYLRTYFMHFYGGAYSDIKFQDNSFLDSLNKLNKNKDKWIIGYPEKSPDDIAPVPNEKLYEKLRKYYYLIIGNGSYIIKPNTQFTKEWYHKLLKTMDKNYEQLIKYPAQTTRQIYSEEYPYPFKWAQLLGYIFHPLCLKYSKHLLRTLPPPSMENYL